MIRHSYGIYSAVFLYRADMFGAFTMKEEHHEVVELVRGFMSALEEAATGENHIGLRYNKLLKNLWFPERALTKIKLPQEMSSRVSFTNSFANDQQPGENGQSFIEPDMVWSFQNTTSEPAQATLFGESGFDPFCGSSSDFDVDLFGMLSQGTFQFGTLADHL
jgi:hypothetical protein